jgi:hypothetical protein
VTQKAGLMEECKKSRRDEQGGDSNGQVSLGFERLLKKGVFHGITIPEREKS